ncbi:MAG: glycosyltransferase family 2 protein [Deltaproteobacteria bacterium]|nr:MAG: glycosyltransferase family 2 protein [Deltaproteobacteria bacterium]
MNFEKPQISVIIPTRNERATIGKCLDSVLNNSYPLDKIEIIVVDGMSSDGTREIVKRYMARYSIVKLLDNPRLITPVALNIGVKAARGDVILILGAHSYIDKDFLSQSIKALSEHPEADCVGGVVYSVGRGLIGEAIAAALSSPFGVGNARYRIGKYEGFVDTVAYGAYRKDVFKKYGLFDERLSRNQDIEFNARLRKHGGRIYFTPTIKAYYRSPSSLLAFCRKNFLNGLWNIYTTKVARDSLSLRHFVPLGFVLSLLASGGLAFFTDIGKILLGLIGGSYLLGALLASISIGIRKGLKFIFILPLAFFTLHFSYGLGSLWGILTAWRFGTKEKRGKKIRS